MLHGRGQRAIITLGNRWVEEDEREDAVREAGPGEGDGTNSERDSSDEQDAIHFRTRAKLIEESPCYGEEWNSVKEALAKFMMARVRQLG